MEIVTAATELEARPIGTDGPSAHARSVQRRAHTAIPGGAHTYAKGDDQFPEIAPPLLAGGSGCWVWDLDGHRYVEYGGGLRANVLGHGHPEVTAAVTTAAAEGTNFTRASLREVETAEAFLEFIDRPDWMVKFTKNGSDANDGAIRLARAVTGRDRVLRCSDHPIFSVSDWFIGTTPLDAGVPDAVADLVGGFPYGDLDALEELLGGRDVAAVLLEAAKYEDPPVGYLEGVRDLCSRTGTVMVLDEIITGFRWPDRTAMQHYGIEPDLATFGKAMGNGHAISALTGRRDLMDRGGLAHSDPRVFLLSYTHGAEHTGLAAATAVMQTYRQVDGGTRMAAIGRELAMTLNAVSEASGVGDHVLVEGLPQCLVFATLDDSRTPSQEFRALLMQELIRGGVLGTSLVVSCVHDHQALDLTASAWERATRVYARALEDGVTTWLKGAPTKPVFRRFN